MFHESQSNALVRTELLLIRFLETRNDLKKYNKIKSIGIRKVYMCTLVQVWLSYVYFILKPIYFFNVISPQFSLNF